MTKRVILVIVIILVGGYFINNYLEKKTKEKAEKAETERIETAIKASIAQLVKRTNANDIWEEKLSKGKNFRLEPILTVELERLWLTEQPILFLGAIKDIATRDQGTYLIEIERSLFQSLFHNKLFFMTGLRLELQCQKQRIDDFLEEHPDLFKVNDVAVIADIDEIETKIVSGTEGEKEEIKVGKGKCVDITYTGAMFE